jgi:glycosyltransferase involved in cell wall biosynthesis
LKTDKKIRIACVQNGNYTSALQTFSAGAAETYNGQRYTVEAFLEFTRGLPSVVVSLDADEHEQSWDDAVLLSLGPPKRRRWIPQRFSHRAHARKIIDRLESLGTTHLLIRCVDVIACELMEWANRRGIPTAAIVAARFDPSHWASRRFCRLANHHNVLFVANHNRVATETCMECGLSPSKAIAWDLPSITTPDMHASRVRQSNQPLRILSAGTVQPAKGIGDLVEGCTLARQRGANIQLMVCGDGSLLKNLREHSGVREGWLQCVGRIPQSQVLDQMKHADVVAVPSRSDFPEGLPFVIQEALALRVPLLLSDHPVFVRYFRDGTGVRFFSARDATSLAEVILEIAGDPKQYAKLSADTADLWAALQCPIKFHHLLKQVRSEWRLDQFADNHFVSSESAADRVPELTQPVADVFASFSSGGKC